jgi:hypothetical protein
LRACEETGNGPARFRTVIPAQRESISEARTRS